jgi:hypothetical protein
MPSHPRVFIAVAVRTSTPTNRKDFSKNECCVDEADKKKEHTKRDINVTHD